MKYYKIISKNGVIISSRRFAGGSIHPASAFDGLNIDKLIRSKFIEEVEEEVKLSLDTPKINKVNDPNFKIRLCIVTGIWKRHDVFEIFANKTKQLKHKDVEICVIVAGSEGSKSRRVVEKHGFKYIEIENQPLAHKMNCTTELAGVYKADFVLCVGSDDIITQPLFNIYVQEMKKGTDFVGTLDWYFYDMNKNKFAYWGGYRDSRRGHTCGAGRMLSSKLMSIFNWKPWDLEHSHVLDNSMQKKLTKISHSSTIFSLRQEGVIGLDIKSETNMTPFELWDNTTYIPETKALRSCVE